MNNGELKKKEKLPFDVRGAWIVGIFTAVIVALGARMLYLQTVKAEDYKTGAYEQYTTEIKVSPERGIIYDRNMKPLAVNATVETVFVSPNEVLTQNDGVEDPAKLVDIEAQKKQIAEILSTYLDVGEDYVLERLTNQNLKYRVIKKRVDTAVCDEIRAALAGTGIVGVHMEKDVKRVYPYGNLASHIIGFTNSENMGILGVEAYYEDSLKGKSGKIVTAQDARGGDMPFKYENYVDAENGTNVVLTIDWEIQSVLEKHLETALADNNAQNRVFGIVVDVNTMEILAMAVKPDYDLNDPYTLDALSLERLAQYDGTNDEMLKANELAAMKDITEPAERVEQFEKVLLEELWKNKVITETYEPGSTFKIITSAMALEEDVIGEGETFFCSGARQVANYTIHCAKQNGHGAQNFEKALQNSCNPVFMELASRVGSHRFFNYFEAYGYTEKTGIDLAGEVGSIYHPEEELNAVELATSAFGQTFKITPIQQICGVSAVANGGYLLKPHVVKALVDDDGNVIKSFDRTLVRRVNSENTSDTIMAYLYNGVTGGSTKNAYVKGYKVAAKTGTSQKRDILDDNLYIGSCVGVAPADDPQVAMIIGIDEPKGASYYGGTIAAPVVSAVFSEILPYLGVKTYYSADELAAKDVAVADYRTLSVTEAKEMAKNAGFEVKVIGNGGVVTEQLPRYGGKVPGGGVIVLYTDNIAPAETVTVPSVYTYSPAQTSRTLIAAGLNVRMSGSYTEDVDGSIAFRQTPEAGSVVKPGTVIEVEFRHTDAID